MRLTARQDELAKVIPSLALRDRANTWLWWQIWRASNYVALPFAGAYVDQPEYVVNDFTVYELLDEYARIPGEIKRVQEAIARKAKGGA
mgnify:CR=1 FL=1